VICETALRGASRRAAATALVIHGVQHPVASRFVVGRGGQVGFAVGRYDHSQPLVIDPVLSLSGGQMMTAPVAGS
jgi:hypothetical protein